MGQVNPWTDCCAARVCDWRWVIVTIGVTVDRQPVSQAGNTVRKIESGLSVPGIDSSRTRISVGCEIPREAVRGKGMANARPKRSTREPYFQVFCGMNADLLQVEKRPRRKLM